MARPLLRAALTLLLYVSVLYVSASLTEEQAIALMNGGPSGVVLGQNTNNPSVQQAAAYCVHRLNYDGDLISQVLGSCFDLKTLTLKLKLQTVDSVQIQVNGDAGALTYAMRLTVQHTTSKVAAGGVDPGQGTFSLCCEVVSKPWEQAPDDLALGNVKILDPILTVWQKLAVDDPAVDQEAKFCVSQLKAEPSLQDAVFELRWDQLGISDFVTIKEAWQQLGVPGKRYNLTLDVMVDTFTPHQIRCYTSSSPAHVVTSVFLADAAKGPAGNRPARVDIELVDVTPYVEPCMAIVRNANSPMRPILPKDATVLRRIDRVTMQQTPQVYTLRLEVRAPSDSLMHWDVKCVVAAGKKPVVLSIQNPTSSSD